MISVAVIGDRYFANRHLVWQVVRSLPDQTRLVLGAMSWAGIDTAEKAADSRGFFVVRLSNFIEQIDTLIVFSDTAEYIGTIRDIVKKVQQRGLHIERYFSSSDARLPQIQMRLFQ